jgi:hypothetical protein
MIEPYFMPEQSKMHLHSHHGMAIIVILCLIDVLPRTSQVKQRVSDLHLVHAQANTGKYSMLGVIHAFLSRGTHRKQKL